MLNAEDSIVASLAFGLGHLSWSGPRSLAPWYLRRPVEVDPHRCPPGALRAEAQAEALPIVRGHRRPAELGDRREPREREELAAADASGTSVAGSQSYAVLTGTNPAQFNPSAVSRSYFMSRYARLPGDRIRCGARPSSPCAASGRQCWTMEVGDRRVAATSSHPIICLPCACTIVCTCSTKPRYCSGFSVFTSSPPMWKYGPFVRPAISPTTSSMKR